MIVLENQRIYQCEGCGRRFVTKRGALEHEAKWCRKHTKSESHPNNCPHNEEDIETKWTYNYEHECMEVDYDYCTKCGTIFC